jgi:hypothetical protein
VWAGRTRPELSRLQRRCPGHRWCPARPQVRDARWPMGSVRGETRRERGHRGRRPQPSSSTDLAGDVPTGCEAQPVACRRRDGLRWIVDHTARGSGARLQRLDPGIPQLELRRASMGRPRPAQT